METEKSKTNKNFPEALAILADALVILFSTADQ